MPSANAGYGARGLDHDFRAAPVRQLAHAARSLVGRLHLVEIDRRRRAEAPRHLEALLRRADDDHVARTGGTSEQGGGEADGTAALHDDRLVHGDAAEPLEPLQHGRHRAAEGDHRFGRRVVGNPVERHALRQPDALRIAGRRRLRAVPEERRERAVALRKVLFDRPGVAVTVGSSPLGRAWVSNDGHVLTLRRRSSTAARESVARFRAATAISRARAARSSVCEARASSSAASRSARLAAFSVFAASRCHAL
jgi:hypothetical protein